MLSITVGWWIIPLIITLVWFWYIFKKNNIPYSDNIMAPLAFGFAGIIGSLIGLVIVLFSWLIYFAL